MGRPPRLTLPSRRQTGYAVIALLAILTAGLLYFVTKQLDSGAVERAHQETTVKALNTAKEALIAHALTYPERSPDQVFGYLPCPDTNGDGEADGPCGNGGEAVVGLLPFKTLGLPDLRDGSGECLWYAIAGSFKDNPKSVPMNWDTQGQFRIVDSAGNQVTAPDDTNGGAAAIIFAVGPPLAGKNRGAPANTPCGRTAASPNDFVDGNYPFPSTSTPITITIGTIGSATNNDQIGWLSPREIFDRVKRRTDFAVWINKHIGNFQANLNNNLRAPDNSHAGDPNWLPTGLYTGGSTGNFYDNWKDHFRYLKCPTAGSYCFTVNSQSCDGVLLFGGASATGNPRPSTPRLTANYFENDGVAAGDGRGAMSLLSGSAVFTGASAYDGNSAATRAQDVGLCLSPKMAIDTTDPAQFALMTPVVSSQPVAFRDDTNHRLQLGVAGLTETGAAAQPLFGCIWFPLAQVLGDSSTPVNLRAYFRFLVDNPGDGFTLTIADADPARNPTTTMCGASGANMGYAGNNGITPPINYPKIAVEFDRNYDPTYGDSPASTNYRQLAFVYWGDPATLDDDNTHGAGGVGAPLNPPNGNPGFKQNATMMSTGVMQYVRLEMQRTYDADQRRATHVLRLYRYSTLPLGCMLSDVSNLSDDLANIQGMCTASGPTISDTITIDDVTSISGAALKRIWIGFTNGQGAQDQRIYVYDLQVGIGP